MVLIIGKEVAIFLYRWHLLSPFMCGEIAIFAKILAMKPRHVDSAAALKCKGDGLVSWLARP